MKVLCYSFSISIYGEKTKKNGTGHGDLCP
mgnify:FL=1